MFVGNVIVFGPLTCGSCSHDLSRREEERRGGEEERTMMERGENLTKVNCYQPDSIRTFFFIPTELKEPGQDHHY